MKMQRYLTLLFFATTIIACNKKDQKTETKTDCRLSKALLYKGPNNAPIIDTLLYTYADANIEKITGPTYYLTFAYSGERITRRNYFDSLNATTAAEYETATYNSDGTISKMDGYSKGDELKDHYQFTYNAGKLATFTYTSYVDGVASGAADTHYYTYTGNNITRDSVVKNDAHGISYSSVCYYMYDDQENHFSKSGTNALFNSALALNFNADAVPFLFSANNVTGFREDPNGEIADFSYTLDANGNLTMMKIFDAPVFAWEYPCH